MNNNFELLCIGITAAAAILALVQSSLALYKTNAPITITVLNELITDVGQIGHIDDNLSFIPVFASDNPDNLDMELCFITLRIINPKSYPITLFNFYVSDENKTNIHYFSRIHAPFLDPDLKLFAKCNNITTGVTLPYSHYITIPPGSFSHVDIIVSSMDLLNSKKLYLTFRDSSKTLLKRKNRRIWGGARINHPLHTYSFHLDAKS